MASINKLVLQVIFDPEVSNVQNVILSRGASALIATLERIDYLYQTCGKKEGNKIFTDPVIPSILQDLCAQFGIGSQTLFNGAKNKLKFESKTGFDLRQERYYYVKDPCDKQGFKPEILNDREVRNSLMHIDERLADILTQEEGIGWFIDYAASIRSTFTVPEGIKEIKYCRYYVHNESRILHLNNELDLIKFVDEYSIILKIVFGIDIFKQ